MYLGTEGILREDLLTCIAVTRGRFVESACHKTQGEACDLAVNETNREDSVFVNLGTLYPPTNWGVIVSREETDAEELMIDNNHDCGSIDHNTTQPLVARRETHFCCKPLNIVPGHLHLGEWIDIFVLVAMLRVLGLFVLDCQHDSVVLV
jgi:hypothetical protein